MKYIFVALLMAAVSFLSLTDPVDITGKVLDAKSGDPVAFAQIRVKGHNIITTAAEDGTFSIRVPVSAKKLECSFTGYNPTEYALKKNENKIIIKMQPADSKLEEVVVTGLGELQAEDQFSERTQQIQGKVAGVNAKSLTRSHTRGYRPPAADFNTEDYDAINENRFVDSRSSPLSTFSIDVDGASYANVRRFLNSGQLPPAGSVRIEELINYFHYSYPQPVNGQPFSVNTEAGACPWNTDHRLVMIGLQGKNVPAHNLPAANLVFLVDVSGSMDTENKLPLVKSSLKLLTTRLREEDRVSIVVYAGNAGLVLPATGGNDKQKINRAIESLEAGGSTAGGAGIRLAYNIAKQNFRKNGNNRVILCTDGDFNVGVSSDAELERLIEKERESGVFLTVLGYGMGNYKDNKMQKLAGKGNGNHSYIDNITEAKKVLVNEFGGTLFTIAKDVKIQVEFNPAHVQAYRLIGYENRMLKKEDFNNDKKDAGDMGSGHTVTALYEVIPTGIKSEWVETTDALRYQTDGKNFHTRNNELMTIKLRYKQPQGNQSRLIEHVVNKHEAERNNQSDNFRFTAAVAEFGMVIAPSEFRQNASFQHARQLAAGALGKDEEGYRKEFLSLIRKAMKLSQLNNEEEEESIGYDGPK